MREKELESGVSRGGYDRSSKLTLQRALSSYNLSCAWEVEGHKLDAEGEGDNTSC